MARRSRSPVIIYPGNFRSVEGLMALQRRIASIPDGVVATVKPALEKGADTFIARLKPAVPVSELEGTAGELRDSVRREDGDTELSVVVIEDGKDEKGRPIAKHVEAGHKDKGGGHVAAKPHFWPAYNVTKKQIKSGVGRAMTKGAKAAFAKAPSGGDT